MRIGLSLPKQRGVPSLPPHLTSPTENFLKSPFPGSRLPDVELFPGASHLPARILGGSAAPHRPRQCPARCPGPVESPAGSAALGTLGSGAEGRRCPPGIQTPRAFAWATCPVLRDSVAPAVGDGEGGQQRNKEKLKMTGGSKGRGCG